MDGLGVLVLSSIAEEWKIASNGLWISVSNEVGYLDLYRYHGVRFQKDSSVGCCMVVM